MSDRTERGVLNHLIETCRDAARGFRLAAGEARTSAARDVLLGLSQQRQEFAEDLLRHAQRLGGASGSAGTTAAALHRAWMHVKARLASDPERAVVAEAARGERFASAAYENAMREILPPDARELVETQQCRVRIARCLLTQLTTP